MKIYEIKNSQYETKQALGEDMGEALYRYHKYLQEHINIDYSPEEVYRSVTSCTYVGEYVETEYIK
jgi:hypothetical protein